MRLKTAGAHAQRALGYLDVETRAGCGRPLDERAPPVALGVYGHAHAARRRRGPALTEERCLHDMLVESCGICRPRAGSVDLGTDRRTGGVGNSDAVLKQDSLTALCRLLGIAPLTVGNPGSSIPSELFDALVDRFGVPNGSMPAVGEAVAAKAGVPWDASCDSRTTGSGGGSTVTGPGMERLVKAVTKLQATA